MTKHIIRLNGIDAPERSQAYGKRAKQALINRVAAKQVNVEILGVGKYGRSIGDVYLDQEFINLWLVRHGWAWHFKEYSNDQRLADAEVAARTDHFGLWAGPGPIPPWQFRHPPVDPNDKRLYVVGKGKRYHRVTCKALDARMRPISIEEARAKYTPCRLCRPPDVLMNGTADSIPTPKTTLDSSRSSESK